MESATVVSRYETQILDRAVQDSMSNMPSQFTVTAMPMPPSAIPEELTASMEPQISRNPDYLSQSSTTGQHSCYNTTPELDSSDLDDNESQSPIFMRRNTFALDSDTSTSTEEEILSQYQFIRGNMRNR